MANPFGPFADLVPEQGGESAANPFGEFVDLVPMEGRDRFMLNEFEQFSQGQQSEQFGEFADLVPPPSGVPIGRVPAGAFDGPERIYPDASPSPRPGFLERLYAAFKTHDSPMQNVFDLASDQMREIDPATGIFKTPEEKRAERLLREQMAADQFAIPEADGALETTADVLGVVGSEIADPAALAAGGIGAGAQGVARVAQLAAAGGGYEAAAASLEQLADEGAINRPGEVAQRAAIGAVAAPVFDKVFRLIGDGVRALMNKRSERLARGEDTADIDAELSGHMSAAMQTADSAGVDPAVAAKEMASWVKATDFEGRAIAEPDVAAISGLPGVAPEIGAIPAREPLRELPVLEAAPEVVESAPGPVAFESQAQEYERLARATSDPAVRADLLGQADKFRRQQAAAVNAAKPKLSPEERLRDRLRPDPENDDLITMIRKFGGIDVDLESDWSGRLSHLSRRSPGMLGVEQKNGGGKSLESLTELLHDSGFIALRDKSHLEELLWQAESGDPVFSVNKLDYGAELGDRPPVDLGPVSAKFFDDSSPSDLDWSWQANEPKLSEMDSEFVIVGNQGTVVPSRPLDDNDWQVLQQELRAYDYEEAGIDAIARRDLDPEGSRITADDGSDAGFRVQERGDYQVQERGNFESETGTPGDGLVSDDFSVQSPSTGDYSPGAAGKDLVFLPEQASANERADALRTFGRRVKHVEVGRLPTSTRVVANSEDVAHVIAPIRKDAQESFYGVLTDEAGNVLRMAQFNRGTANQATIDPSLVASVAANTPGAKKLWVAHNHPNGGVEQSDADRALSDKLADLLDGSRVSLEGSVVVGPGGRQFSVFEKGQEFSLPTPAAPRSESLPVSERRLVGRDTPFEPINRADDAHVSLGQLGGDRDGVMLVDSDNRPVGFLPLSDDEMRTLRAGDAGGSQRLMEAMDETQAEGFFVRSGNRATAGNMGAFAQAHGKSLLDVIDHQGNSFKAKDEIPLQSTFYSNPFLVATKQIAKDVIKHPGRNAAAGFTGGVYSATTSEEEVGSANWWLDVAQGTTVGLTISQAARVSRVVGEGSLIDRSRKMLGDAIEGLPFVGRGPVEVRELKRKQRLMRQIIDRQTEAVGQHLRDNFTPSERGQIADLIENRGITKDFNAIHKQAEVLDNYLSQVGGKMKDLGMLSDDVELGGYLHRYYAKKLGLDKDFRVAKGQSLGGSYTIARGTSELFDANYFSPGARAALDAGELKGSTVREFVAEENGQLKSFFFMDDEVAKSGNFGLRSKGGPDIVPADFGLDGRLKDFSETDRVWSLRGAKGDKVLLHRDWSQAEREAWGEIKDAGYRYVRGMAEVSHDLSLATLYKDISKRADWVSDAPLKGFVEVPNSPIAGSKLKRYGALAGKYVRRDVWSGVSHYGRNIKIFGSAGEVAIPGTGGVTVENAYRHLVNKWKLYKTVYNPVTHLNNTSSNVEMLYMSGYSAKDLGSALKLARQGESSEIWREAQEYGLFGADWSSSITAGEGVSAKGLDALAEELRNQPEIPDAVLSTRVMMDVKEWFINSSNAVKGADGVLRTGAALAKSLGQPVVKGLKVAKKPIDVAADAAQRLYRFEDEIFKLAVYQAERAKGTKPEDAVNTAQQFFFDYNDLPDAVKVVRDFPVGSPFISYTYLAIPAMARNIAQNPEKVLALVAGIEALNYSAQVMDDEVGPGEYWTMSEAKDDASPPWDKGRAIWGARNIVDIPDIPHLPSLDGYRLSLGRMHALGNPFVNESGERAASVSGLPAFWGSDVFGSNPVHAIYDVIVNEDWRGKPIFKDKAPSEVKAKAIANYLYQAWAPSNILTPGSYHQQKIIDGLAADKHAAVEAGEQPGLAGFVVDNANAIAENLGMTGFTGVDKLGYESSSVDATLGSFGIKLRPPRYKESISFKRSDIDKDMRGLNEWFDTVARDYAKDRITVRQYADQKALYDREREKIQGEVGKVNSAAGLLK